VVVFSGRAVVPSEVREKKTTALTELLKDGWLKKTTWVDEHVISTGAVPGMYVQVEDLKISGKVIGTSTAATVLTVAERQRRDCERVNGAMVSTTATPPTIP
jgi:hypothetical protein